MAKSSEAADRSGSHRMGYREHAGKQELRIVFDGALASHKTEIEAKPTVKYQMTSVWQRGKGALKARKIA